MNWISERAVFVDTLMRYDRDEGPTLTDVVHAADQYALARAEHETQN